MSYIFQKNHTWKKLLYFRMELILAYYPNFSEKFPILFSKKKLCLSKKIYTLRWLIFYQKMIFYQKKRFLILACAFHLAHLTSSTLRKILRLSEKKRNFPLENSFLYLLKIKEFVCLILIILKHFFVCCNILFLY